MTLRARQSSALFQTVPASMKCPLYANDAGDNAGGVKYAALMCWYIQHFSDRRSVFHRLQMSLSTRVAVHDHRIYEFERFACFRARSEVADAPVERCHGLGDRVAAADSKSAP